VRLSVAVDHFNKDYKKGLQHLQNMKLLPQLKSQKQQQKQQEQQAAAAAQQQGEPPPQQQHHDVGVEEEDLATCLGQFLRVCPGELRAREPEALSLPHALTCL
jgi:hypothetical protein